MSRHASLCLIFLFTGSLVSTAFPAPLRLIAGGKTQYTIVVDPDAIAAEKHAAKELGCRWWSSKVSTIPRLPDLTVPEQHVRYVPPLEYRESFWMDAFDGDWAARNRCNGHSERLEDKHGGKVRYGGPFFVHTFAMLVPPATYFKEHPEYFSEVGGRRLDGYAQVCVTNEAVKKLITAKVLAYLREDPNAQIISVSQNDCDNHCHCANCKKLEDEEGSPAGPLLHLVNYVAAEVAKQYPHVAIDTLAYQYTRKPPRHIKPLPNVIVRLCSIECDIAHPLTAFERRTIGVGRTSSPPPPGCEALSRDRWIDLQDATFNLAGEGTWATTEGDESASDKTAARMPGNHHEWAVQQWLLGKPLAADAVYDVYASIRVEKTGSGGPAFSAGIYDTKNRLGLGQVSRTCAEAPDSQYHVHKLGSTKLHGDVYLWVAPARNPQNVRYIWVDRFWLVKRK